MTADVFHLNSESRPAVTSLITAFENAVDEVARGKMTPAEVIGAIEIVKQRFYEQELSMVKKALDGQ